MRVFVDESGDAGFKLGSGSTPFFIAAMAIFQNDDSALATQSKIEQSDARKIHKGEFKFSKCCNDIRDAFCECVKHCDFSVRAIVVEKKIIYSPRLRSNKDQFYRYFVRNMISYSDGELKDAKVIIDGSGDRKFRQELHGYFDRQISSGVIKKVSFRDSKKDSLIQLADMCAGAIARSYREDRKDAKKWREILAPRIQNVWEFR